jgi:acyl carrier protein
MKRAGRHVHGGRLSVASLFLLFTCDVKSRHAGQTDLNIWGVVASVPEPHGIERMMDIFARHNAKTTFFVNVYPRCSGEVQAAVRGRAGAVMNREQQIRAYIVDNFLLGDSGGLDDGQLLFESGVIDSTGVMELALFVEEAFGVKVEDRGFVPENFDSILNLAAFVDRKEAARDAAAQPPVAGECP